MTKRTLSLKRETLTELSDADLAYVAGANVITGTTCPLGCIVRTYPNCLPTRYCPTLFC